MQLAHAITNLETAVETQLAVAGAEVAEAGTRLMAALRPAIRQSMMEVVAMAVSEISSQLEGQNIDIKLVDGDPELAVSEDPATHQATPPPGFSVSDDADEARITVRLPSYLKDLITAEAESAGDSVNSYVVEVLGRPRRRRSSGNQTRTTLEL